MPPLFQLENFEVGTSSASSIPANQPENLPGYDAGFAAGQAAAMAQQSVVEASLVEALSDMSFGFEEARQHILGGLAPLFQALIDQLLPRTIEESFHARLAETLQNLALDRARGPVRLIVHPNQVAAVSTLLPSVSGLEFELHQDPEVGQHGALISQGTSESILDVDDLIEEIRKTLSAIFDHSDSSQELSNHG